MANLLMWGSRCELLVLIVVLSHNPICGRWDCIEIASGEDNTLPEAVYNIVNFLGWIIPLI